MKKHFERCDVTESRDVIGKVTNIDSTWALA